MRKDTPQRRSPLREIVNGLRFIARTGLQWRCMSNDLPPWRRLQPDAPVAGCRGFRSDHLRPPGPDPDRERTVAPALGHDPHSRPLQSTPESGACASWDGAKRRTGTKVHLAVDTLGELLAIHVNPAKAQDCDQVGELAAAVQEATVTVSPVASIDAWYTGDRPKQAAAEHGINLCVVTLPEAKRGFVLLPRRWVAERDFA